MIPPTSTARDLEETEVPPSPFRDAFGRARVEALSAAGPARESLPPAGPRERPTFEYRLVKRRGGRSLEEAAWNALGHEGWELVGVTGKHAAFKRRVTARASRP